MGHTNRLRANVFERFDFEVVSSEVWSLLHSWYGGGPKIAREAVQLDSGAVIVELNLLKLRACSVNNKDHKVSLEISQTATVRELKVIICARLGLTPSSVHVLGVGGRESDTLEVCR